MRTFVLRYSYGKKLDKFMNMGITCPICGQNKVTKLGKLPKLGWGFRCRICDEIFYINIVQIDSKAPNTKVTSTTVSEAY